MGCLQKALAGACLLMGIPVIVLATLELTHPNTSPEDRSGASAALFIFGLPPTTLGLWLVWSARQNQKQAENLRIKQREQLFLNLLCQHQGRLTLLQFATAAEVSMEESKAFLDDQAKLLNATFEVSETGAIVYCFPV